MTVELNHIAPAAMQRRTSARMPRVRAWLIALALAPFVVAAALGYSIMSSSSPEADGPSRGERAATAATDAAGFGYRGAAAVAAVTALFASGVGCVLARSLRDLESAAKSLQRGDFDATQVKPHGPLEVREAVSAMNEAAENVQLVERQLKVLADGRLDDPLLRERAPGTLGASLQRAVQTLTGSLNDNDELRRRLSHEATHDGLTQLANRKATLLMLEQSVARIGRGDDSLAVMFIDLDDFKGLNDNHGHQVGDAALWTLGKRLRNAMRVGDQVGRIGGDEFLIIAEPVGGIEGVQTLARRIERLIAEPIEVGGVKVTVTASIGVAVADARSKLTATEILYDADLAVYRAKELGGACVELCDESLHAKLLERAEIEEALRKAIAADQLTLFYQPIINARTAELTSLEALVRWERPGHGLVPPNLFIPVAERSDLITEVDNWVVRRVVRQLEEWSHDPVLRKVPISINVSGRHLSLDSFVDDMLGPVHRAGINPSRLIVEVTESALLDDLDQAAGQLERLRQQSIRVAIDDFGTGYTSLGHLRVLPVDILKIDRSFVSDESARSLVKLIVDTGHLIGASITAEGIETIDQAAQLTEMGADSLQGFLFTRPMPPAAVQREVAMVGPGEAPFVS